MGEPITRVVLLRHGRTAWNAERRMQGRLDPPLDETGEAQAAALRPQIEQLVGTMKQIGATRKGDTVDIDLVDGATRIALNGETRGQPIPGEDFYAALLRVFLGPRPADADLKKGLLGG